MALVLNAVAIDHDELLPSLRAGRRVKDTCITGRFGHVNNVVAAATIQCQESVGLDEVLHRLNCRVLLGREEIACRKRQGLENAVVCS